MARASSPRPARTSPPPATLYADFPSVVFTKPDSGITGPADLKGTKLGIPGKYGSSWVMLQALLDSVGLTPADLQIVEFPDYGQRVAVEQGVVDSATGFVNNEPIQMKRDGTTPVVLTVDQVVPLPGPGLIAGQSTIDGPKREAVQAFVAATLRAMREMRDRPSVSTPPSTPCRVGQRSRWPAAGSGHRRRLASARDANGLGAIDPAA
jgi:NitT/TauT family transport system substrate-binding protein